MGDWRADRSGIVVGLDLGPSSAGTMKTAIALAQALRQDLVLCHAIADNDVGYEVEMQLDRHRHCARGASVRVSATFSQVGSPADVLLATATATDARALIVGIGARCVSEDRFFGRTAERVLRSSQHPVMLHHRDHLPGQFQSLLCVVDYCPDGQRALADAVALARRLGADLHVLHVHRSIDASAAADIAEERRLRSFVAEFDTTGVCTTARARTGCPVAVILNAMVMVQPSLLIVGRRGSGNFLDLVISGVGSDVLCSVHSSLLVIGEHTL